MGDFQQRMPDGYAVHVSDEGVTACVHGDREALSRALWNLLDNAVKYSPGHQQIWVDLIDEGDHVRIGVRDEGLGIPIREQREVFDHFVRGAESTARRIKGTGIGLAMVREIMRAHGGEVRLESEVDRGVRSLSFCLYQTSPTQRTQGRRGRRGHRGQKGQPMARILVVEDEPGIAFALDADLRSEGYEVALVANGVEALKIARTQTFDLVLLDVMLPGKDGFEVCRELRRADVLRPSSC